MPAFPGAEGCGADATGGASAILEPPAEEPAATYRVRIEGDLIITVERDE